MDDTLGLSADWLDAIQKEYRRARWHSLGVTVLVFLATAAPNVYVLSKRHLLFSKPMAIRLMLIKNVLLLYLPVFVVLQLRSWYIAKTLPALSRSERGQKLLSQMLLVAAFSSLCTFQAIRDFALSKSYAELGMGISLTLVFYGIYSYSEQDWWKVLQKPGPHETGQ